jgi:hypothetical protein
MTDLKPSQLFEKLTAKVTIFDQHLFWFKAQLKPTKQDPSGVHDGDTVNAVLTMVTSLTAKSRCG